RDARIRSRCETTPTSSPLFTTGRWRTCARSMISLTIQSVSSAEMRTTFIFIMERTATIGLSYHDRPRGDKPLLPWGPNGGRRDRRAGARAPAAKAPGGLLPGGGAARRAARPFDLLHHRG